MKKGIVISLIAAVVLGGLGFTAYQNTMDAQQQTQIIGAPESSAVVPIIPDRQTSVAEPEVVAIEPQTEEWFNENRLLIQSLSNRIAAEKTILELSNNPNTSANIILNLNSIRENCEALVSDFNTQAEVSNQTPIESGICE